MWERNTSPEALTCSISSMLKLSSSSPSRPCGRARKQTTEKGTGARRSKPGSPSIQSAKVMGHLDVPAQTGADPLEAEAAQHPPQLEGAEAAAELNPVIHEIDHLSADRGRQVFGHQREGAFEDLGVAGVERRGVDRGEKPLVGVEDKAVGVLAALQAPAELGAQRRRARVGRIDVEPQTLGGADLGDRRHRIHRCGRGRADGGHHRQRAKACGTVGGDRTPERLDVHPVLRIVGHGAITVEAETEGEAALAIEEWAWSEA